MISKIYKIFTYNRKLKKNFYYIQLFIIIFSLIQTLSLILIKPLVEGIISNHKKIIFDNSLIKFELDFYIFSLFFIFIFILSSFLSVFTLRKILVFSETVAYNLKKIIFLKYINLNYTNFLGHNSSDIQTYISVEINRAVGTIIQPLLFLVYRLIPVIMITIFLCYINLKLTFFLFSFMAVIIFALIAFFKSKLKMADRTIHESFLGISKSTADTFRNFKQIKVFQLEKYFFEDFKNVAHKLIKVFAISRSTELIIKSIIEIIFILFLFILSLRVNENTSLLDLAPNLAAYIFALYRFLPGIQTIYATNINIRANKKSVDLLNEINLEEEFKKNFELDKDKSANQDLKSKLDIKKKLEFKGLGYKIKNKIIFDNACFVFETSKIHLLKGDSGSGKTTLVDIISGLINPQKVDVYIDGKIIDKQKYTNIINQVSYCTQKTALFNSTVQENITFKKILTEIEEEKLNKIIKICRLDNFMGEKELGLKSNVVENGENFSGGQIQRIGLARCLFREFDILILDESTSALDKKVEEEIIKDIKKNYFNKLIFIISHSDNLDKYVDQKIYLKSYNKY